MPRGRRNARSATLRCDLSGGASILTSSRTVIVAGAGIGGLTTALALARNGFRVVILEQAERLDETGAGIQLSANAARTLIDLGLEDGLRPHVVAPAALRVLDARTGREIVRMPLGQTAAERYGAPHWVIHRGDLQGVLSAAAYAHLDITVKLGMRVEDFAAYRNGVTVSAQGRAGPWDEHGHAFIAADGLWSTTRGRIGPRQPPRFAGRVAWRALLRAKDAPAEFREPLVNLWIGRAAHLVHYPIKGGSIINIVAITADGWNQPGWSEPASGADLLAHLPSRLWAPPALALVRLPEAWLKWALYDRKPLMTWSQGPVALLGDAAHPMLPFLAQGAALAIEDAAVVAQCLARRPDDAAEALRAYSGTRRWRARKVQRLAARNGRRYHLAGISGMARNTAMRIMGGERLLRHYDWLYDWRPPAALPVI